MIVTPPLTIVNILGISLMFKTYDHAMLNLGDIFGEKGTWRWQFVELDMHHPWFYVELVRDYSDDIMGSMLMVPTVPILQQMLSELDERSWFAQVHLVAPGHMRGGKNWAMEPLIELSVAEDAAGTMEGYLYTVEGGMRYSTTFAADHQNLNVSKIIFSAERDLRRSR